MLNVNANADVKNDAEDEEAEDYHKNLTYGEKSNLKRMENLIKNMKHDCNYLAQKSKVNDIDDLNDIVKVNYNNYDYIEDNKKMSYDNNKNDNYYNNDKNYNQINKNNGKKIDGNNKMNYSNIINIKYNKPIVNRNELYNSYNNSLTNSYNDYNNNNYNNNVDNYLKTDFTEQQKENRKGKQYIKQYNSINNNLQNSLSPSDNFHYKKQDKQSSDKNSIPNNDNIFGNNNNNNNNIVLNQQNKIKDQLKYKHTLDIQVESKRLINSIKNPKNPQNPKNIINKSNKLENIDIESNQYPVFHTENDVNKLVEYRKKINYQNDLKQQIEDKKIREKIKKMEDFNMDIKMEERERTNHINLNNVNLNSLSNTYKAEESKPMITRMDPNYSKSDYKIIGQSQNTNSIINIPNNITIPIPILPITPNKMPILPDTPSNMNIIDLPNMYNNPSNMRKNHSFANSVPLPFTTEPNYIPKENIENKYNENNENYLNFNENNYMKDVDLYQEYLDYKNGYINNTNDKKDIKDINNLKNIKKQNSNLSYLSNLSNLLDERLQHNYINRNLNKPNNLNNLNNINNPNYPINPINNYDYLNNFNNANLNNNYTILKTLFDEMLKKFWQEQKKMIDKFFTLVDKSNKSLNNNLNNNQLITKEDIYKFESMLMNEKVKTLSQLKNDQEKLKNELGFYPFKNNYNENIKEMFDKKVESSLKSNSLYLEYSKGSNGSKGSKLSIGSNSKDFKGSKKKLSYQNSEIKAFNGDEAIARDYDQSQSHKSKKNTNNLSHSNISGIISSKKHVSNLADNLIDKFKNLDYKSKYEVKDSNDELNKDIGEDTGNELENKVTRDIIKKSKINTKYYSIDPKIDLKADDSEYFDTFRSSKHDSFKSETLANYHKQLDNNNYNKDKEKEHKKGRDESNNIDEPKKINSMQDIIHDNNLKEIKQREISKELAKENKEDNIGLLKENASFKKKKIEQENIKKANTTNNNNKFNNFEINKEELNNDEFNDDDYSNNDTSSKLNNNLSPKRNSDQVKLRSRLTFFDTTKIDIDKIENKHIIQDLKNLYNNNMKKMEEKAQDIVLNSKNSNEIPNYKANNSNNSNSDKFANIVNMIEDKNLIEDKDIVLNNKVKYDTDFMILDKSSKRSNISKQSNISEDNQNKILNERTDQAKLPVDKTLKSLHNFDSSSINDTLNDSLNINGINAYTQPIFKDKEKDKVDINVGISSKSYKTKKSIKSNKSCNTSIYKSPKSTKDIIIYALNNDNDIKHINSHNRNHDRLESDKTQIKLRINPVNELSNEDSFLKNEILMSKIKQLELEAIESGDMKNIDNIRLNHSRMVDIVPIDENENLEETIQEKFNFNDSAGAISLEDLPIKTNIETPTLIYSKSKTTHEKKLCESKRYLGIRDKDI